MPLRPQDNAATVRYGNIARGNGPDPGNLDSATARTLTRVAGKCCHRDVIGTAEASERARNWPGAELAPTAY